MTGKNDPTKWEDLILDTLRPEEAEEASRQEAVRAAEGNSNEDSPIEFSKDPLQLDPSDNYAEVMTYLQTKPVPRKRTAPDGSTITEAVQVPVSSGYNFLQVLRYDHRFSDLRYNTVRGIPERFDQVTGKRKPWTDADDADARLYMESVYGITGQPKYDDALRSFLQSVRYNPVQLAIEATAWDGKPHAEGFLTKWMGADDNPVNRECSRLLFAGAIRRAYEPGCKFDCCIVLIGSQGGGKSTICRWLALEDDFYTSLKTISGQKGSEAIQGKWIAEVEELLAFIANNKSGSNMEESAKAYLSRQSEFQRLPYDRRPTDTPRTNIFIGTTNRDEFLEDPTGNRRWYPVTCHGNGIDLFEREKECREDIRQAYAEMLVAYKSGDQLAKTYTSKDLEKALRARQQAAEVEDSWVGLIEYYLDENHLDEICTIELWNEAINYGSHNKPLGYADSRRIGYILRNKLGWDQGKTKVFPVYGRQKSFTRPSVTPSVTASVTPSVTEKDIEI